MSEVKYAYDMVSKWSKTEAAPFSMNWYAMKPQIRKEPKGVVLIISPFNYPLWCLLGPFVRLIPVLNPSKFPLGLPVSSVYFFVDHLNADQPIIE